MSDEVINCADCRTDFSFTENEAKFFAEKGLTKPRRCQPCRRKRRAEKEAGGQASPVVATAPPASRWVGGGEEEAPRKFKGRDKRRDRGHEF